MLISVSALKRVYYKRTRFIVSIYFMKIRNSIIFELTRVKSVRRSV